MRNQFLWTAGFVLAAVGFGFGARAASPYDDPNVRQGSNPATQTIGLKSCGAKWIPYNEVCPLYQSTSDKPPEQLTRDASLLARTSTFENCDVYEPYSREMGDDAKWHAKSPESDTLKSLQPWVDIGKARGMKWGCHLGSLDDYIINDVHGDACARGDYTRCASTWWNNALARGETAAGKRTLEGPVAERVAMVRGIQRELSLPEAMLVREEDCAGPVRERFLRAFGKDQGDGVRMSTPYWVKCAMQTRAASWGLSPAVAIKVAQCKKPYDTQCEFATVVVEGRKHEFKTELASLPGTGTFVRAVEELGGCDNRLAQDALTTTNEKVPWKKKHLEMIRENCLVAAAMIADPVVSAWATSVAATLDQAIARKR